MMVYPSMLVEAARQAGMKTPPNPDKFNAKKYPHFQVFCVLQLCHPITWGEHWENAKVIAAVPDDKITTSTLDDFLAGGLKFQT